MKFFEKGMIVDFLKGELARVPIPTCKYFEYGMDAQKGSLYIYGNSLVVAEKDATYNGSGYDSGDDKIDVMNILRELRSYYWGDYIHGVTVKYKSNSESWDRLDHWMLGMYLRWQKRLFGQDWLYGYNCWDGEYLGFNIRSSVVKDDIVYKYEETSDGLLTLTVPVVEKKEYTIWGDSPVGALLALGYSDKGVVLDKESSPRIISQVETLRRNQPIVVKIGEQSVGMDGAREYLTLFIQIPRESRGVFVAEGDYTDTVDCNYGTGINRGIVMDIENSSSWNTACTDRVIEGITGNVINGQQFSKSIEWVQKALSSNEWGERTGARYQERYRAGVWDTQMQQWILNKFKSPMLVNGKELPAIKNFNGEAVKEVEQRIKEVMGYVV